MEIFHEKLKNFFNVSSGNGKEHRFHNKNISLLVSFFMLKSPSQHVSLTYLRGFQFAAQLKKANTDRPD